MRETIRRTTFVGRRIAATLLRWSRVCRCSKKARRRGRISRAQAACAVWSKSLARRNWGTSISARATSLSPSKERNDRVAGEFFHVQRAIDANRDANQNRARRRSGGLFRCWLCSARSITVPCLRGGSSALVEERAQGRAAAVIYSLSSRAGSLAHRQSFSRKIPICRSVADSSRRQRSASPQE